MTRSGVSCLRLKMMEAPKRGSVGIVHIQQALKQMKKILLTMMKEQTIPRVLRQQNHVLRRQWLMRRSCVSFR
ncbi:hypothetical protein F2Q70_00031486 [Brassica cretica]|uniref:Uncharacterized protein n=1 Tax=Brassica cretica TaxID=69181 RepID=A0A8S9FP32_BRACR|nr:hypothetical protein F2Q70_00031486 [Brassica cretica]KAF3595406.1 hypothetical protein DY000_02024695 [Brassica cretica]